MPFFNKRFDVNVWWDNHQAMVKHFLYLLFKTNIILQISKYDYNSHFVCMYFVDFCFCLAFASGFIKASISSFLLLYEP